jgi:hypothetical protein
VTAPLVDVGPCLGDRYEWITPDGARVLIEVRRVNRNQGIAHLRCHYAGRTWTRRQDLPLYPSMKPYAWTAADLLEPSP